MGWEFKRRIEKQESLWFNPEKDSWYVITISARCNPGQRNKWWLSFKGLLEDILNLHLDDDDLRVEIDTNVKFPFNSPASFSGTKMLGELKTVVFIVHLSSGKHQIKFIPDGSPFIDEVNVKILDDNKRFTEYFGLTGEGENYYSWFTFALVNLPLNSITTSAKVSKIKQEIDDDDLKIAIDGVVQKKEGQHHPYSYFCGFTSNGRETTFKKEISLMRSNHTIEFIADNFPVLRDITLVFEDETPPLIDTPVLVKEFNSVYVMKDKAFIESGSMSEDNIEEFLKNYGESHSAHLSHRLFEGRKSSFWIKKYSSEAGINPKIILTKLQAEARLINGKLSIEPQQDQFDWSLGFGKTDEMTYFQFKGFLNQLREGALLLNKFFHDDGPPFKISNVDGNDITVHNRATYALYRYTPHKDGADLFYRIYKQFFGEEDLGGQT